MWSECGWSYYRDNGPNSITYTLAASHPKKLWLAANYGILHFLWCIPAFGRRCSGLVADGRRISGLAEAWRRLGGTCLIQVRCIASTHQHAISISFPPMFAFSSVDMFAAF